MSLIKTRFPCRRCEYCALCSMRACFERQKKSEVAIMIMGMVKGVRSHLRSLALKSVEDGAICRVRKASGSSCFLIMLISNAHTLGSVKVRIGHSLRRYELPVVKSISKWLMDTGKIFPCHEYLARSMALLRDEWSFLTRSKAVEQARGCVTQKIGFCAMTDDISKLAEVAEEYSKDANRQCHKSMLASSNIHQAVQAGLIAQTLVPFYQDPVQLQSDSCSQVQPRQELRASFTRAKSSTREKGQSTFI